MAANKTIKEIKWNSKKYAVQRRQKKEEKENKEQMGPVENKQQRAVFNSAISVISLNVDGLNTPIKRQRLSFWIKKSNYILPIRNKL